MTRHRSLLDLKKQGVLTTPPRRTLIIRGTLVDPNVSHKSKQVPPSPPRVVKREPGDYVNPLIKLLSLRGCPQPEILQTPSQVKQEYKRIERATEVPKPPLLVRKQVPRAVRRVQEVLQEEACSEPAEEYCYHNFKLPERKS